MKREDNESSILIELDHVSRSYGAGEAKSYALKDFSLEVKRGEFIMIMGPSGCGKTTLLNVIGLLDRPTAGSYILNGRATEKLSSRKKAHIRSRQIGYIFQNFNLISTLPVIENVALPLVYSGKSKTRRLLAASEMLETFHLDEREYYYPHQLSGGQQQRVCIARSLVNHPEIILADEPTGNLDSRSSHIVMEELRNIHSEGNTIIMVTHNPALTTYATRVIHMLDGQIDADIKTVSDENLPQFTGDSSDYFSEEDSSDDITTEKNAEKAPETSKIDEKNSSDDIKQAKKPAPKSISKSEKSEKSAKKTPSAKQPEKSIPDSAPSAPLGEIADIPLKSRLTGKNVFPVVGSTYIDKSVRITSKPTMEDLVVLPEKPASRRKKGTK